MGARSRTVLQEQTAKHDIFEHQLIDSMLGADAGFLRS